MTQKTFAREREMTSRAQTLLVKGRSSQEKWTFLALLCEQT